MKLINFTQILDYIVLPKPVEDKAIILKGTLVYFFIIVFGFETFTVAF